MEYRKVPVEASGSNQSSERTSGLLRKYLGPNFAKANTSGKAFILGTGILTFSLLTGHILNTSEHNPGYYPNDIPGLWSIEEDYAIKIPIKPEIDVVIDGKAVKKNFGGAFSSVKSGYYGVEATTENGNKISAEIEKTGSGVVGLSYSVRDQYGRYLRPADNTDGKYFKPYKVDGPVEIKIGVGGEPDDGITISIITDGIDVRERFKDGSRYLARTDVPMGPGVTFTGFTAKLSSDKPDLDLTDVRFQMVGLKTPATVSAFESHGWQERLRVPETPIGETSTTLLKVGSGSLQMQADGETFIPELKGDAHPLSTPRTIDEKVGIFLWDLLGISVSGLVGLGVSRLTARLVSRNSNTDGRS
jgi:hypothetical protein